MLDFTKMTKSKAKMTQGGSDRSHRASERRLRVPGRKFPPSIKVKVGNLL